MRYTKIGKTDINASVIALGTWGMAGDSNWGPCDDEQSIRIIHQAMDMGINLIDTAPAYGFYHSEKVLGKAITGRRDKVFISTKCGLRWDSDEGFIHKQRDGLTLRRNLTPASIREEIERSLKALNTDYIDLYITHWQTVAGYEPPNSVTMEALCSLKKEGKIRGIGLANADAADIKEYTKHGTVDLIQNKYSMLDRDEQREILELCKSNGITFQPYSALEKGILGGKITVDTETDNGARAGNKWYERENREKIIVMLEKMKPLCDKYSCSLSGIVLAWTLQQTDNMVVLCGSRKLGQVEENAAAADILLDASDLSKIDEYLRVLLN